MKGHRQQPLYISFLLHRLSGLGLAIFLPFHLYVLGMAFGDGAQLDVFLHWSEKPIVKFAEFGLVFLLALHMFGGLRLMALEWLPWSGRQKTLAAGAAAISFLISGMFLLRAI
jgi:fumarate reductase subunit D